MTKVNETPNPLHPRLTGLIEAGAPVGDAIRITLSHLAGEGARDARKAAASAIPAFAERHALNPKATASAIYGNRKPTAELCEALATELGGAPEMFLELLWPSAQPIAFAG